MKTKIIWKLIDEKEYFRRSFSGDAHIAMNVAGKLLNEIPEDFWKANKELINRNTVVSSSINIQSTLEKIGLCADHYELIGEDTECYVHFKNEITGEEIKVSYSDCDIDYVRGDVMFFKKTDKKGKDTIIEEISIGD